MIQVLLSGMALGCIYALIALGFVLIYKATETVNFAQGEMMMLGAMAAVILTVWVGLPIWAAVGVAIIGMTGFGLLIERLVVRPVLGQPQIAVVMLTIGLGYMMRGGVTMLPMIGTRTNTLTLPYQGEVWAIGSVVISVEQVMIIAMTLILCAALYGLFRYTRIGIAMQATSQNQIAAYYMGIPVKRLNGLVWGLSVGLATIAGILLAPITFVHANMGFIALKAIPAVIVGGFGSLPGAVLGGLVIGLVEALAGYYLPEGYRDIAPYAVVLLVLVLRPTGILGERLEKKV